MIRFQIINIILYLIATLVWTALATLERDKVTKTLNVMAAVLFGMCCIFHLIVFIGG